MKRIINCFIIIIISAFLFVSCDGGVGSSEGGSVTPYSVDITSSSELKDFLSGTSGSRIAKATTGILKNNINTIECNDVFASFTKNLVLGEFFVTSNTAAPIYVCDGKSLNITATTGGIRYCDSASVTTIYNDGTLTINGGNYYAISTSHGPHSESAWYVSSVINNMGFASIRNASLYSEGAYSEGISQHQSPNHGELPHLSIKSNCSINSESQDWAYGISSFGYIDEIEDSIINVSVTTNNYDGSAIGILQYIDSYSNIAKVSNVTFNIDSKHIASCFDLPQRTSIDLVKNCTINVTAESSGFVFDQAGKTNVGEINNCEFSLSTGLNAYFDLLRESDSTIGLIKDCSITVVGEDMTYGIYSHGVVSQIDSCDFTITGSGTEIGSTTKGFYLIDNNIGSVNNSSIVVSGANKVDGIYVHPAAYITSISNSTISASGTGAIVAHGLNLFGRILSLSSSTFTATGTYKRNYIEVGSAQIGTMNREEAISYYSGTGVFTPDLD